MMKSLLKVLIPLSIAFGAFSCTYDSIDIAPVVVSHHHVACGDTTHLATTKIVHVMNFQFMPDTVHVSVGDTVRFVWESGTHTTTSISVPSGAASWDHSMTSSSCIYEQPITVAGTYNYKCTPHFPTMVGTIIAQ